MATKLYDLAVKTGEYPDGQGGMKGRYENVGSMMQGDNGPFMILKRTFNPAGVPNPDCKDSIIVSAFEPKQQGQQQGGFQQQPQQQGGYQQHQNGQNGNWGQPQQPQQPQQQYSHNHQY